MKVSTLFFLVNMWYAYKRICASYGYVYAYVFECVWMWAWAQAYEWCMGVHECARVSRKGGLMDTSCC